VEQSADMVIIVLEAKNREDAVCIARDFTRPIDLMITDMVMPHMSCAKLAGQLAAERPGMKVLFLSGYAENTVLRARCD
jgi:YesN/AraC family two-component response regulator